MSEFLALAAVSIGVPLLSLTIVTRLAPNTGATDPTVGRAIGPTGWRFMDDALSRLTFWPAVAVCVLSALLFMAVGSRDSDVFMMLALIVVGFLFFRAWRYEFVGLMASPDESFPGRFDKRMWVLLMVVLPPVGFTCLRAYRRAMEPEGEPQTHAKPASASAHDLI